MKLNSFKHDDWVKIWEGKWSFLSCSHFGEQYTKELRYGKHPFKDQSIMFSSNGRSSGWMRQKDRDRIGNYLSSLVAKTPRRALEMANTLKFQAKEFLKFIAQNENTVVTQRLYREFWDRLLVYYHAHISVKYVVDYLDPRLLKKYLPKLQEARLAAEPVLNRTEDFMIAFTKLIGKKTKYDYKLVLCLSKQEIFDYFKTGKLPKKSVLKQRNKKSVLLHEFGNYRYIAGREVQTIDKLVQPKFTKAEVKGAIAYPGKARGVARLVASPHRVRVFDVGDILIAGSTRPEYLPLMQKAAAIVTDAGGILSHAAIVAREMRKPCVIGTKNATQVLKDGDKIEVDANKGIVKRI